MPLTLHIAVIQHRPKCSLNRLQDQGCDIPELKVHSLKSKTASVQCFVSPFFILSLSLIPLNEEHMYPPPHPPHPSRNKTFSACIHYFLFFICLSVHSLSMLSDRFCSFLSNLLLWLFSTDITDISFFNFVLLFFYILLYTAMSLSVQMEGFVIPIIHTKLK